MIEKNKSLKPFNTFGIDVKCQSYSPFKSVEELKDLLQSLEGQKIMILGGGSNVLLTKDFDGAVLRNEIRGINVVSEQADEVIVRAGAGEVWHEFVLHCIDKGLGGIENLSLIPGSVGASPMQNIGAYGVEIKDVFVELEALNRKTFELEIFDREACNFGYRESVFKRALKDQYIITSVTYRLNRSPKLNTSYGIIEQELAKEGITHPTIKDVSNAVINIRSSKLPDPKKIGNAGSFFKNPIVDEDVLTDIQKSYDQVPNYPASPGKVKLAAGWLIEQAGWKGKTFGTYGVHKNQALVLVNYGDTKGSEILDLSEMIIKDIEQKFGVTLEREVNII